MPALSQQILDKLNAVRFENSAAIDEYFRRNKRKTFIQWFNDTFARRGVWDDVVLTNTPANDLGFHRFWNQTSRIFGEGVSLPAFTALMSILANEVRANFTPVPERLGRPGHPGIAYAFNRIEKVKRSYNTLAGNQTAFACFNDPVYLQAHGALPLADRLSRTTDTRWQGEVFPPGFPTDTKPSITGFLLQADFMKFRGRGFIQTTGRANYKALIHFVQSTDTANATLDFFRLRWQGMSEDAVADATTNENWDTLFGETDLILAAEAIRLHNQGSGNYLNLSANAATLQGEGQGSLHRMGLRISGGTAYAVKFRDRALAVLAEI